MSWTAPFTAVAGGVLTAAQVNTFIRDNLAETMPARASALGSFFAVSGANEVSARVPAALSDAESVEITTTSFGDPATGSPGPSVTVTCGGQALVGYRCTIRIPSATARIEVSYAVSGATEREASTTRSTGFSVSNSASGYQQRSSVADLATVLEPGINTFTLKYNVSSGSGFVADRRLWVLPL